AFWKLVAGRRPTDAFPSSGWSWTSRKRREAFHQVPTTELDRGNEFRKLHLSLGCREHRFVKINNRRADMDFLISKMLRLSFLTATAMLALSGSSYALPTNVSVTPPDGARFFAGQRFDLRVEGRGTGPFSATIRIDGVARAFTSGAQTPTPTGGISSPGGGGFNLRGYTNGEAGLHSITATFSDATGTVTVTNKFRIIDLRDES